MTKQQLEAWVHQILDRVLASQPIEDSHVELKREWLADHHKVARRLAGHANASRGEPVLWIVGVDEKAHAITGAVHTNLADWMNQVNSQFDELAPDLTCDLAIQRDGVTVIALLFDSSRCPYVVRTGSSPAEREVPWRQGTQLMSAKRRHLLAMLLPMASLPQIELVKLEATAHREQYGVLLEVQQNFYLEQPFNQTCSIPMHKCSLRLSVDRLATTELCTSHDFRNVTQPQLRCSEDLLIATGSTYFQTLYRNRLECDQELLAGLKSNPLMVVNCFGVAGRDRHITVEETIANFRIEREQVGRWFMSKWQIRDEGTTPSLFITP